MFLVIASYQLIYKSLKGSVVVTGRCEVHQEEQGAVRVLDRRRSRQAVTSGGVPSEDAQTSQHCAGILPSFPLIFHLSSSVTNF